MTTPDVSRGKELPRKTLHLTTASIPVALSLGMPQRTVAVLLVTLFGVAVAVEFARRRSPAVATQFDATVGVMLRPHEAANGITGATWLLATFAITCLAAPLAAAIAATWAGAVGDASAAVVGKAWRRARGGEGKTFVGSAACVIATALGAWWLAGVSLPLGIALGLVAAIVERPAISLDDNVRVTAGTALAAVLLLRV
jgi:dolichol kinase